MTRATDQPVRRVVRDRNGREYVVEVRADTLSLRPLRSRRNGPADVAIAWGQLYTRALMARPVAKKRRRAVRRGLL